MRVDVVADSSFDDNCRMLSHVSINATGIVVFNGIVDAVHAGYQIVGTTGDGYLVRTRTDKGWALAIARVSPELLEH